MTEIQGPRLSNHGYLPKLDTITATSLCDGYLSPDQNPTVAACTSRTDAGAELVDYTLKKT